MKKYVFVMSHAFSGSTLLSFLLGAHPEIATIGEMGVARGVDVEDFQCSCGERIHDCAFWSRVHEGMEARGLSFDLADAGLRFRSEDAIADRLLRAGPRGRWGELARSAAIQLWPKARAELRQLLRRHEVFVSVVTEIHDTDVFLDITKRPGRVPHLARVPGFELYVIHLTRDARAVAHSTMKNLGRSAEQAARSWLLFYKEGRRALRLLPASRGLAVRYEDLCLRPGETLSRIHRMIGVVPQEEVPDFRAVEHHIIGNRMRLQSSSEIRLDEKWRSALSLKDLAAVERMASDVNRSLGYDSSIG